MNFSENLEKSIDELYKSFRVYKYNPKMDHCPCCIELSEVECLGNTKLRELSNDDLSKYAFKAITTWGGDNDFKYFLPRILELLFFYGLPVDCFVIFNKMYKCHWTKDEKNALDNFLWNASIFNTETKEWLDKYSFCEIFKFIDKSGILIEKWKFSNHERSLVNFVELFDTQFQCEIKFKKAMWKKVDTKKIATLFDAISKRKDELVKIFYHIEQSNPEVSWKILSVLEFIGLDISTLD